MVLIALTINFVTNSHVSYLLTSGKETLKKLESTNHVLIGILKLSDLNIIIK